MSDQDNIIQRVIISIKWCAAILLIAQGYLHFTTSKPFYEILTSDLILNKIFGGILLGFGIVALLPLEQLKKNSRVYMFVLPGIILLLNSITSWKASGYLPEQLIEHSTQIALPFLLVYVLRHHALTKNKLYFILASIIGLTFIGHATYALGVHHVPENFIEMTMRSLFWMDKQAALQFLFVIGLLDVLFTILAFIPGIRRIAIWYLIIWGFITALARTYYVLDEGVTADLFLTNVPNTVYRLPHGILPIAMLLLSRNIASRT